MDITQFLAPEMTFSIGWMLIHSLWQYLAVASMLAIISKLTQRFSGAFRYGLFSVGMLLCLTLSVITFLDYWRIANDAKAEMLSSSFILASKSNINIQASVESYLQIVNPSLKWIVLSWISISAFLCLQEFISLSRFERKMLNTTKLPETAIVVAFNNALNYFSDLKNIKLFESANAKSPMTFGLFRKYIFLPVGLATQLHLEQIELIILHELAHIKRHDFAIGLLQSFIKNLFFFNPALYWISHNIDIERENACDDIVISMKNDSELYTATLAEIAAMSFRNEKALGIHNGSKNLLKRIKRQFSSRKSQSVELILRAIGIFLLFGFTTSYAGNNHGIDNAKQDKKDPYLDMYRTAIQEMETIRKSAALAMIDERRLYHFEADKLDEHNYADGSEVSDYVKFTRYKNPLKVRSAIDLDKFKSFINGERTLIANNNIALYKKNGFYFICIKRIDSNNHSIDLNEIDRFSSSVNNYAYSYSLNNLEKVFTARDTPRSGDLLYIISTNAIIVRVNNDLIDFALSKNPLGPTFTYAYQAVANGTPYAGAHKSGTNELTFTFDRRAYDADQRDKLAQYEKNKKSKSSSSSENIQPPKFKIREGLQDLALSDKQADKILLCYKTHLGYLPDDKTSYSRDHIKSYWTFQISLTNRLPLDEARKELIEKLKKYELRDVREKFWVNIYDDSNITSDDPQGLNSCEI